MGRRTFDDMAGSLASAVVYVPFGAEVVDDRREES